MNQYGPDHHIHVLEREQARLRELLKHILGVAHNPDCSACAQVRYTVRQGLATHSSPLDDWRT